MFEIQFISKHSLKSSLSRSAAQNNLTVPLATNTFANRTFIVSSTSVWNDLPVQLKTTNSLLIFKSLLKKHVFK